MAENGASAKRTSDGPGDVSAHPEGVPCWVDAQLSDVEAGKRFYGELFGWTFTEPAGESAGEPAGGPAGVSVWARLDGEPVAALVRKTDGRMPTVWSVYFHTPDAAALAERIRAGGGQVVTPPHPVGGLGTTALAADPDGAVFALWQPAGHPGFGRRHEPGTFTWAELYTRDTEAANAFYGDLFHDALFGPDAAPDFGRAPVSSVFPAQMPPHFLVHFLVGDVEAALGMVARLGGRVRVPPFETSYGGVAVVSDDQGASFALLQR
ncbi:VOC family protein [Streptomyces pactum]|uniref:Hydrolase n=1 Tax=Streptomyces pactum TaxID=68249 RepID=A0A1S6JBG7_9ACTN|nr:hydrolase [Streptomyces pactum]